MSEVSGVPIILAMVSLTLAGLLYAVYTLGSNSAAHEISSDPAVLAILLAWIALVALAWFVVDVFRSRGAKRTVSLVTKVALVVGAMGFLAAVVVTPLVEPIWVPWLIADVASVLTGASVARVRGRRVGEGVLLGLLLATVGVVIEALLEPRTAA